MSTSKKRKEKKRYNISNRLMWKWSSTIHNLLSQFTISYYAFDLEYNKSRDIFSTTR